MEKRPGLMGFRRTVADAFPSIVSKAEQTAWITAFHAGETMRHSARAVTLPHFLNLLEQAGEPYVLEAVPGYGYAVKKLETKE